MKRSVLLYAIALVLSLGAAYRVWTAPPEPDDEATVVTVLEGKADDLESVHYRSDKLDLVITMHEDDLGRYGWVRAEPLGEAPPAPAPDDPHAPPPDDGQAVEFKVGKNGKTTLDGLMPLVAKRVLEGITDDKLADLGLDESAATLEIQRRGREPKTFEVGSNASSGANVYLRDPETGKVYVLDAKVLRPLQSGKQTLPERDLIGVGTNQIASLRVIANDGSAEFQQHNPDDSEAVFWSTMGSAEANPAAAGWIDKVVRLQASGYVQASDAPGPLEDVFTYAVTTTGRKTITVQVQRGYDESGEELWYAKSDHTRGLVKLQKSRAAEVVADLASVVEGA
jgi:hypothetical protein